jgi:hypothetical protein
MRRLLMQPPIVGNLLLERPESRARCARREAVSTLDTGRSRDTGSKNLSFLER